MRLRKLFPLLAGIAMTAVACGPAQGGGVGGPPGEFSGRLLVDGGTIVQTLEFSGTAAPHWTERFSFTIGNALPAVDVESDRFHMARFTSGPEPFSVESYDLTTFAPLEYGFEWPDTSDTSRMKGLVFSPDGRYAAAVLTFVASPMLSIVDLSASPPVEVLREFSGSIGDDLVWLDASRIAFVLDVQDQTAPGVDEFDGAIVAMDVPHVVSTGTLDLEVHVGFAGERWINPNSVTGLALSPDGSQLVYSFGDSAAPDLMLKDLSEPASEPQRLTAGPNAHFGPAFSPDGTMIAFVEYHPDWESSVFVVPNHRGQPILIEDSGPVRERHLVADGRARRVLAWLP